MLENLKQWVFERAIRKQKPRQPRLRNYNSMRNVLVLYKESDGKGASIERLQKQLIADGKEVTLFGLSEQTKVNFFECPPKQMVADLQRIHYDLLIDLTLEPCRPMHYLALYASADCKAGLELTHGIHDFMIAVSRQVTPTFLFDQILHYLKMINSKLI